MSRTPFEWLRLDPGEEVVWTGSPRRRPVVGTVAFFAVVAGVVAAFSPRYAAGVGLLGIVVAAIQYAMLANTAYVLTDSAVYRTSGVLGRSVTRVAHDRVQNTSLSKGVLGTRWGYGSIEIDTAAAGTSELRIGNVDDPDAVKEQLSALVGRTRDESLGKTAGAVRGGPAGGYDGEAVATAVEEARALREAAGRVVALEPETRR